MKSICICFLLFICTVSSNSVKIDGLKSNYTQNEKLTFRVVNYSAQRQYFFVSVEQLKNNEWRELITDIKNPRSKTTFIDVLEPHKTVNFSIPVKVIIDPKWPNGKKFRLKAVYDINSKHLLCSSFSSSFKKM